MNRALLKEWTDILVPWIQVIGLLFGGGFAIYEYKSHQHEARIERAVGYLTRLNSGELLDASTKLSLRELNQNSRLREILEDNKTTQDQKNADYYRFVVCGLLMHGQDQSLESSLFLTLGFLDDGIVCSKQGLCDEQTIRSNLGELGKNTVRTYYPYFCYLRRIWNDKSFWLRVEKFYDPLPNNSCRDYEESIKKTGVILGPTYSCKNGTS
jgi:hypothetical protein